MRLSGILKAAKCGSGFLSLELTDKPIDHELVLEAPMVIDRVRIHGSSEAGDEWDGWRDFDLGGNPIVFDLVQLRGGVTQLVLNGVGLPAGTYGQLRLHVQHASLTLVDGDFFTTDDEENPLQAELRERVLADRSFLREGVALAFAPLLPRRSADW